MRQPKDGLSRLRVYLEKTSFAYQQRLPPERELAQTLGLTRSRLRTGLQKLDDEGLIWRHVGKGTFYGPKLEPAGFSFPRDTAEDLASPHEVMTARLALEPALAAHAALKATVRDLQTIRMLHEQMAAAKDWNAWDTLDCRLHRTIAVAAGSRLMLLLFDTVQAHRSAEVWGRLREAANPASSIRRAGSEHAAIIAALSDRNQTAAEAAMKKHLLRITADMFGGSV